MNRATDNWFGRRVMLTGGTGFVGYHVARQLVAAGARVTALVRPSSNRERLRAAGVNCVEGNLELVDSICRAAEGCEIVFHVAGSVSFTGDWASIRRVNVVGTERVISAARRVGARRLVFTSSIVAVGASEAPQKLDESAAWNLARFRVPYVTTKREAEQLALAAAGRDLEVVAVNPGSVIGPEDFTRSEFGTLCRRFWHGRIPFHFGGGNNFVDVRDVAAGHLLAASRGKSGERYILGGENLSMGGFFTELARYSRWPVIRLQLPPAVAPLVAAANERLMSASTARPYLSREQARLASLFWYYSNEKARRELGYASRPLSQSIADTHAFCFARRNAA